MDQSNAISLLAGTLDSAAAFSITVASSGPRPRPAGRLCWRSCRRSTGRTETWTIENAKRGTQSGNGETAKPWP